MVSSFLRFLDHTQRRTSVGRTPLDEWSARRRGLYLTNTQHSQQIPMPPRSHKASGRKRMPWTARPLGPAGNHLLRKNRLPVTHRNIQDPIRLETLPLPMWEPEISHGKGSLQGMKLLLRYAAKEARKTLWSQGIFSSAKYLRAVTEECGRMKFLLRLQESIKIFWLQKTACIQEKWRRPLLRRRLFF